MSTQKQTILIGDDDPAMLRLLSRVLEIEGFRVVPAPNSAVVLKLAAKRKELALIIIGLEAKEQEGIQICRRLRGFTDVPVIILAAKYEEEDIPLSKKAGADDFIRKPVSMAEFVARVKAVLHRRDPSVHL